MTKNIYVSSTGRTTCIEVTGRREAFLRKIVDLTGKRDRNFDWIIYRALSFGKVWRMSSAQESSYTGRRHILFDREFDQSVDHTFV